MAVRISTDMDFLAANIHGRRSRLAEADRLDELCRIRSLPELARALYPELRFTSAGDLQRIMVMDQVTELSEIASKIGGAPGEYLDWLRVRFQMENLKVLARCFAANMTQRQVLPHLVPLPEDLSLDTEVLCRAGTLEAFTAVMTRGPFKQGLLVVADLYKKRPKPFFVEAGLDHGYLVELLRLARGLRGGDRDEVLAIACQEVDTFHLALAARGRFHYDLKPEMLVPLHVPGSRIAVDRFRRMVAAERLADLVPTLVGTAIDALPPGTGADNADASLLEHLAWNRYYRLANRTFRRSHMGMGAVAAYAAIRRVELANLIRLTEGIRAGFDPKAIRRRLIPRSDLERARV